MNEEDLVILVNNLEWSTDENIIEFYWTFRISSTNNFIEKIKEINQSQLTEQLILLIARFN